MSSGQKFKFRGTVARRIVAKGSKNEHEAIVLLPQDGLSSPPLKIRIQGGNPFHDTVLDQFVGKRVSFEAAVVTVGIPTVIVEKLSDISVISPPPKKAPKNNGPRP